MRTLRLHPEVAACEWGTDWSGSCHSKALLFKSGFECMVRKCFGRRSAQGTAWRTAPLLLLASLWSRQCSPVSGSAPGCLFTCRRARMRAHTRTHAHILSPLPHAHPWAVSYLQCLRLFKLLLFFWLSNDVVPCQFTKSLLAPPPLCHLSLARPTRACPSGRADGFPGVGVGGG